MVECSALRRTEVGRGDQTDWHATFLQRLERAPQHPNTRPPNEGHDHVNAVRGSQLTAEHLTEARLVGCVHEQIGHGKRQ